MKDKAKKRIQPEDELVELRRRIAELEKAEVEQKRMEEALRESEARFRTAIESLPFDFFVIDESGRYVMQNSTCRERWGDVIGKRPEDLGVNEDTLALWKSNNRRAFGGEVVQGEVHFAVEGEEGFYHNIISPIHDGDQIQGILGVNIDITERKRTEKELSKAHDDLERRVQERTHELLEANKQLRKEIKNRKRVEEALRDSVENFRALAANANDGILIAAGEGNHVYANKRAAEITGYSVAELLKIGLHDFTAPDEVDKVADRYQRRLNGENVPGQYETALVKKSGEIFPAELSSARSVWEGQLACIVIFRDITGRKQAEEALRKREAELEIRASELEELNSALRVLLKRREEDQKELEEKVLSNVKELVLPYVERLKKSALDAKQDTYVNILESNLENIVSPFVRQLSSSYLALTPTEIHVAALVREAKDTKTIADLMNLSPRTVESHRQNIRKKLGLKNKKANLRTRLLSIQ